MAVLFVTQRKVKQHHNVFRDTDLEVAERNMLVMEIKYLYSIVNFITFIST